MSYLIIQLNLPEAGIGWSTLLTIEAISESICCYFIT